MNYREPRQILGPDGVPTGKWRFTTMNDGVVWASGYCSDRRCEHDTAEEAAACYREWLLDHRLRRGTAENRMLPCEVCGEFTRHYVEINHTTYTLCEKHYGREHCAEMISGFYSESSSY